MPIYLGGDLSKYDMVLRAGAALPLHFRGYVVQDQESAGRNANSAHRIRFWRVEEFVQRAPYTPWSSASEACRTLKILGRRQSDRTRRKSVYNQILSLTGQTIRYFH